MEKQRYEVQLVEYIDYGDGETQTKVLNTYKTYARTTKEAIRNLEYRTNIHSTNSIEEMPGDGFRKLYFTAKCLTKNYEQSQIEKFKNDTFKKCPYCGYNNEKKRLSIFNACLSCHKPLDNKDLFKEKLLKKMEENK